MQYNKSNIKSVGTDINTKVIIISTLLLDSKLLLIYSI